VLLLSKGFNYDEFRSGKLPEKQAVTGTWEPFQHLLEDRVENQQNSCREEQSQGPQGPC
jgi:hypothetical protein